jgi:hypothetical protein
MHYIEDYPESNNHISEEQEHGYKVVNPGPILESKCFSYPNTYITTGSIGDDSGGDLWYSALLTEGATIEDPDISTLPIGNNNSPIPLTSTSFSAILQHIDDDYSYPGAGNIRTMRTEEPVTVNGVTLNSLKGFHNNNGSRLNGHSAEFVFNEPVGIIGLYVLNMDASIVAPAKIQAWDENNTLIVFDVSLTDSVNNDLMFIGISDPRNRIKTIRFTVGQLDALTQSSNWGFADVSFGRNVIQDFCDVRRVTTYVNGVLTIKYYDEVTSFEITDANIIQSLQPDM